MLIMKPIPVSKYDLQGNLLATYNGLREAARDNGLKPRTLADHVVSGKPLSGWLWRGPCQMQSKAERSRKDRERKLRRIREALAIDPYRDMENLLSLLREPEKAILGHRMQKAIDDGGSPRMEFARWYIHQYEIDIASDDIVAALGYTTPCDE